MDYYFYRCLYGHWCLYGLYGTETPIGAPYDMSVLKLAQPYHDHTPSRVQDVYKCSTSVLLVSYCCYGCVECRNTVLL